MVEPFVLDCRKGHDRSDHLRTCFRPAEVSDLVEALQAEGVGTEVGTEVMTSDGYERRVIPVHWTGPRRFLVVPLGEDA